jgi:hypothetical protein
MNKGGQFYLIAAIIIVTLIIGFATVSNVFRDDSSTKLYDFGEEFGFEGNEVIEHGVYSEYDEGDMELLLENFAAIYKTYIDQGGSTSSLHFVIGNKESLTLYSFTEVNGGSVNLDFSGKYSSLIIQNTDVSERDITGDVEGDSVSVVIDDINYDFNLRQGQNFYFFIEGDEGATSGGI